MISDISVIDQLNRNSVLDSMHHGYDHNRYCDFKNKMIMMIRKSTNGNDNTIYDSDYIV